ncbi:asparagine synthase (glutamine-hydrolyzing) [Crossiella sp. CA-258035]|uniref:asparagine synthase (glutamine-hydrolyzing) n=1 Tax=Crossiella sp. CA-258035 TaxID=2981138 RepID=UPI0024BCDA9A|nr:asparagine synthase (glutamine-hydrolyzing) [Crossiella sp. CA-258035]WHT16350.1 asparagine synthase (glutamine-hydrolyzing) [Crossiella sp. CA-258035]
MCRIYGYFGHGFHPTALDGARDAQLSGGPDVQQHTSGPDWGIGCNRLSIQDPSTGRQPFRNAEGTVHAVFNGEIYNFRAIRAELAAHGVHVDGDSDGSVLVPYYELHGDRFTERLEGMFAIAVVDLRRGRELKLWCDHLAVKSLYYAHTQDGIAFSSELRGLTALVEKPLDVDPLAVDDYLNWQCQPNGSSWHTGVSALHPGEVLVYDGRSARTRRWWQETEPVTDEGNDPERLAALLEREVAQMSLQSAPIAVQVSGGLDSSVLATLLKQRRGDVTGFHVTHEGTHDSDELAYARDSAAFAGIPLEVVEIREAELPELIPATVAALGAPNATPHALSAYALFREISAGGFRVCFVGDGADEQFGGYRRYSTALAADEDSWAARYLDRLSLVPEAEYRRLYTPEYRELLDSRGSSRQRALELLARPAPSRLEQLLSFDRLHKLPSLNLRKLDHLSMAHAVEGRVPYCQPEVTRFARRTPDTWKINGSSRKKILWDAGARSIPASVAAREKQPFTFPVSAFMAPGGTLWDFAREVLARPRLCASGFLSEAAVRQVVTEHGAGQDHSRLLWGLMVLEISLP